MKASVPTPIAIATHPSRRRSALCSHTASRSAAITATPLPVCDSVGALGIVPVIMREHNRITAAFARGDLTSARPNPGRAGRPPRKW